MNEGMVLPYSAGINSLTILQRLDREFLETILDFLVFIFLTLWKCNVVSKSIKFFLVCIISASDIESLRLGMGLYYLLESLPDKRFILAEYIVSA